MRRGLSAVAVCVAVGAWTCSGNAMSSSYAGIGETATLTRFSH